MITIQHKHGGKRFQSNGFTPILGSPNQLYYLPDYMYIMALDASEALR